jgi:phenylalanine ammonia-lyase
METTEAATAVKYANAGRVHEGNVFALFQSFAQLPDTVTLLGTNLSIQDILAVARHGASIELTQEQSVVDRIATCYEHMMANIREGTPVYGCNTAFGAQAARLLVSAGGATERIRLARALSDAISFTDVSVGPLFDRSVIRAAMLIRMNMLMQGLSGVKLADIETYQKIVNAKVTPVVSQYGGVGASGDLAHNSRVLSAARQLPGTLMWDRSGKIREATEVLREEDILPLMLDPKAGLGLVNGDNFSTALASLIAADVLETLLLSFGLAALVIEVLNGSDRVFHPMLSIVRPHPGQDQIAHLFRFLLRGSRSARNEMAGPQPRKGGTEVQDAYSLRAIAQYHGPNVEKLAAIFDTVVINANSVSDNPLWVAPEYTTPGEVPWQWVSGGNFLAMHMTDAMDGLRKVLTQVVKLNDRHLARMVNQHYNHGLSANLSDPKSITQCAFKGVQIQSGMLEVYSTLLSIPVATFFGIHEEGNQDITSHALTSGILALENLKLARYSIAQNLVAAAQAVDLRGGATVLAPQTRPLYRFVREHVSYVQDERPLGHDIEAIYSSIVDGRLPAVFRASLEGIEG